jgi:hypothetical protein
MTQFGFFIASIGTKTVNQPPLQSASQSDIVPSQADSPSITVSSQSSNLSTLDLLSELEAIERELTRRLEELARTASQNPSQSPFSSTPQNTSNNIPTVDGKSLLCFISSTLTDRRRRRRRRNIYIITSHIIMMYSFS